MQEVMLMVVCIFTLSCQPVCKTNKNDRATLEFYFFPMTNDPIVIMLHCVQDTLSSVVNTLIQVGPYVKLELGRERAFFINSDDLTHVFKPCGHVTTEKTAK